MISINAPVNTGFDLSLLAAWLPFLWVRPLLRIIVPILRHLRTKRLDHRRSQTYFALRGGHCRRQPHRKSLLHLNHDPLVIRGPVFDSSLDDESGYEGAWSSFLRSLAAWQH